MTYKAITLAIIVFIIWPVTNCLATTRTWIGSTSDWNTASNWSPAAVPVSGDIVQIGVSTQLLPNFTYGSFINPPTVSSTTAAVCSSIEFGPDGTITLTVNGTLTVSGNIVQDHPTFSENITTSITGTGTINCVNFTVGNSSGALSFSNTTTVKCNIAALNISGNLTAYSVTTVALIGIGVFQNNAVFILTNDNSVNNTVTVTGQLVTTNTNATSLLGFVTPFAAIDIYVNGSNTADMKLLNSSAISIGNSSYGQIDFYVPSGGTGSSTVEYAGTSGTQTVYTNGVAGLDNSPATYQNITFSGAATKSIQSGNLLIYGNWSSATGKVDAFTNTPSVYFEGTSAETLTDLGSNSGSGVVFDYLYCQGGGAKSISSGKFSIASAGVLTMGSSTSLNANGDLTLLSNASSTASVAPVVSGASITGNVNVQRYVFGSSTSLAKRGYRFISSSVNAASVTTPTKTNVYSINYLQDSTYLSGPTGGGFNAPNGANPSAYLFREDVVPGNSSFTSGNWKGIEKINNSPTYNIGTQSAANLTSTPDITVNLPVGNGFIFYFVGNQSNNSTQTGTKTLSPFDYPENVKLTQVGNLNTGTINVRLWFRSDTLLSYTNMTGNSAVRGYCLIGNPYASSINWEKFNRNGTSSTIYGKNFPSGPASIYMFNQSNKQYEVYQQKTGTIDTTSINPSTNYTGAATNIISSGQAFFIRAAGANQSISFRENAKTTTQPSATVTLDSVFNALPPSAKAGLPDVPNPSLRFKLIKDSVNTDEIVVSFSDQGNVKYNAWDAEDIGGLDAQESLSALSADSVKLAIHTVPLPVGTTPLSVPLFISATSSGLYKLNLADIANLPAKYQVWLMDRYKKDSLDIRSYLNYGFNIDLSDTTSYGSNRFAVVIRENPAMVTRLLTFNAVKAAGTGILTWTTNNANDAATYCIQRSTDNGKTFTALSTGSNDDNMYVDNDPAKAINLYRLQYTMDKKQQFSNILSLDFSANPAIALTLYPNPTANLINLKINNNRSNNYTILLMSSSGSVINKSNAMDTNWQYNAVNLLPGAYIISVYDNREHMPVGTGKFIKQ